MELQTIQEIVKNYLDIDVSTITEETSFKDMQLDSLDMIEIVMDLEDKFSISIPDDADFQTVGDLIQLIQNS